MIETMRAMWKEFLKGFAPSPKNREAAEAYVKEHYSEKKRSEFAMISKDMFGHLMIAAMMFVFAANSIGRGGWMLSTILCLGFLTFGSYCVIQAYRLHELLQVFDDGSTFASRNAAKENEAESAGQGMSQK